MIPVARPAEPATFDVRCRQPGRAWMAKNADAKRPRDYWSPFRPALADGFRSLCGYGAMYVTVGSVDHFVSTKNQPDLAYEWSNYRFIDEWINKSKKNADDDVLDPFEVGPGWFEIQLPSLQLKVTDKVPAALRDKAEYTLKRLHLRDDERVIRQRRGWYEAYQAGHLTLDGLARFAPLIADAVRQQAPAKVAATKTRAKRTRAKGKRR